MKSIFVILKKCFKIIFSTITSIVRSEKRKHFYYHYSDSDKLFKDYNEEVSYDSKSITMVGEPRNNTRKSRTRKRKSKI